MSLSSQRWWAAGALALCACTARPPHPELAKAEPATSGAMPASEAIAHARCEREAGCNNVGIDKRYVSLEDCLTRAWTAWQGDPIESECADGIDPENLETCLAEIRVLECSVQLTSLELVPACAANLLCAQ